MAKIPWETYFCFFRHVAEVQRSKGFVHEIVNADDLKKGFQTHRNTLHAWYIYLHESLIFMVHVGRHDILPYMDIYGKDKGRENSELLKGQVLVTVICSYPK